jgi:hypothetical protein
VMAGVLGRSGSRDRDGRRRERRREWRERGREIVSLWTDRECAQELTHRQALSLVSKMEAELSWSPPVSLESHRTACSGLRRARTAPRSDFGGVRFSLGVAGSVAAWTQCAFGRWSESSGRWKQLSKQRGRVSSVV